MGNSRGGQALQLESASGWDEAHPEVQDLPGRVVAHDVATDGRHSRLIEGRPQLRPLACATEHALTLNHRGVETPGMQETL